MEKYFILNFLSFENTNVEKLIVLLLHTRRFGAISNFTNIFSQPVNSGYMISYSALNLIRMFPLSKFILIKEDPKTILKHLMFGYYQSIYPPAVLEDFRKYFEVDITNIQNINLIKLINDYYEKIEVNLKNYLITIDLSKHDSSFINFLKSSDFDIFCQQLAYWMDFLHSFNISNEFKQLWVKSSNVFEYAQQIKNALASSAPTGIKDYFIKSFYYGLPDNGDYINFFTYQTPESSPLEAYLKDMDEYIIEMHKEVDLLLANQNITSVQMEQTYGMDWKTRRALI